MSPTQQAAYDESICAQVIKARYVPARLPFPEYSQPNFCDRNVERYVAANPGCQMVRGWILHASGILTAHFVVRGEDGELFDITPFPWDDRSWMHFVPHEGDELIFEARRRIGQQIYCAALFLGASRSN